MDFVSFFLLLNVFSWKLLVLLLQIERGNNSARSRSGDLIALSDVSSIKHQSALFWGRKAERPEGLSALMSRRQSAAALTGLTEVETARAPNCPWWFNGKHYLCMSTRDVPVVRPALALAGSCLWRSKGEHWPWYAGEEEVWQEISRKWRGISRKGSCEVVNKVRGRLSLRKSWKRFVSIFSSNKNVWLQAQFLLFRILC